MLIALLAQEASLKVTVASPVGVLVSLSMNRNTRSIPFVTKISPAREKKVTMSPFSMDLGKPLMKMQSEQSFGMKSSIDFCI